MISFFGWGNASLRHSLADTPWLEYLPSDACCKRYDEEDLAQGEVIWAVCELNEPTLMIDAFVPFSVFQFATA